MGIGVFMLALVGLAFVALVVGITVERVGLSWHRRATVKEATRKQLQKENHRLMKLVKALDTAAEAEYTVTGNMFAATVSNTIEQAKIPALTR